MSAPLSPTRCVCQATSATDPTDTEHEVWCPSRKPTAERIAEIKAGSGPVMLAGELEWLAGDASRAELHISGAAAGAFPLSDDLPGLVAELGRKLGAAVAELDRTRSALTQSENDLTGARLDRWEEEQESARLRRAWLSARRGRAAARETDAKRLKLLRAVQKLARDRAAEAKGRQEHAAKLAGCLVDRTAELLTAEARVAELEAERHSTNEALSDTAEALREKTQQLAALEESPLAWAEKLDAKSLDNLLITLSQAADYEPMSGAIGQIHEVLAGFREAADALAEREFAAEAGEPR